MSPPSTQDNMPLVLTTPLGKDALLLVEFRGSEALSELFTFHLQAVAEVGTEIDFGKLLGAPIGVELGGAGGEPRHFDGICSSLAECEATSRFVRYELEMVPRVWELSLSTDCRIFQSQTIPDILKVVLQGQTVRWDLRKQYEPRDYCVQYRETNLAFASRLMEDEGIFYFFEHKSGSHTLVVADDPTAHPDVPHGNPVQFETAEGGSRDEARVLGWMKRQRMRSGKVTLRDHHFAMPPKSLEASEPVVGSLAVGTVTHQVPGKAEFEIYDYPGGHAKRFDGVSPTGGAESGRVQKVIPDGRRTAEIRMEQDAMPGMVIEGAANCLHFAAGHSFTLEGHASGAGAYVLTSVTHEIKASAAYVTSRDAADSGEYWCSFTCIPAAQPTRPERKTPRPVMRGAQTAVVVGPKSEEIFTDEYGRVRVQFHWDREGRLDGAVSCWLRVATHTAGKMWGAINIPRIGQEVLVDFLEGDPDRPIVVGSVYNAEQMPPYKLPDNRTQSGLKTRSSPKGKADNFNELRFEDKAENEHIYFHAEKDFERVVENDDKLTVGMEKKDEGTQTILIYGDRSLTIEDGGETVEIKKGDRKTTIGKGGDTLDVKLGDGKTKFAAGSYTLEAMKFILLKVGGSSIKIEPAAITIKAPQVKIQGTAMLEAKAPMTTVKGDAMLTLKGGITMIN